jgi:hypothetical protein
MGWTAGVGGVLLASVARPGRGPSLSGGILDTTLVPAACFHGISGYVHRLVDSLDRRGFPEDTISALTQLRLANTFDHLRKVADLRYLQRTFAAADIPWLLVKGPTLAVPVHGSPELRAYSDLDPLVPPPLFGAAIEALEENGSELLDRNWSLYYQELKGEVHLRLPTGTALDLHWHLLNDQGPRQAFPMDLQGLFERRREVDVSGVAVPTLDAVDTVLYVTMHAMVSGAHRLIWLKDIERLLDLGDATPEATVRRAREWRAEVLLRSALERLDSSLGVPPLGEELLARLNSTPLWSAVTRRAWAISPPELEDGSGSIGRIVARAIRNSQGTSFATLARRGLRYARETRLGRKPQSRQRREASDPGSGHFDSGGELMRRDYLRAVAAQR